MIGVIAWAIVESENRDSWRYFVMHLLAALPILSERPTTFMSDRDKGLMQKHYYLHVFVVHIVVSISKRILLLNSLVVLQISFGRLHDPILHTYTTPI